LKRKAKLVRSFVGIALVFLLSCQEQHEIDRLYSSYLDTALILFQQELDSLTEGTAEGQYKEGTKSIMQNWLDDISREQSSTNSQMLIDSLFRVSQRMEDSLESFLNPYFSVYEWKLDQAKTLHDYSRFESFYDSSFDDYDHYVDSLSNLSKEGLTQEMLNQIQSELDSKTSEYVGRFRNGIFIPLINSSFEAPYDSTIVGWQEVDSPYEWSPQIDISKEGDDSLPIGTVNSGSQVLRIGSYTGAAVQSLRIGLFPTLITTISFHASLDRSEDNWQGRSFETIVRSSMIVEDSINGKLILGERFHSLGFDENFDDFLLFQHKIGPITDGSTQSRVITLEFITREAPFFLEEWSETFVFLDQIEVKFSIN